MDINDIKNETGSGPKSDSQNYISTVKRSSNVTLNIETMKSFFHLTGGSLFYCISAVFVAYGIVNLMGPILSEGQALKNALPCIFTLHIYELALLGVLILIVSRKVADDAVSVVIFMAIFLVGTSIALGSVADKGIPTSVWVGIIGVGLAFGKFYAMWRFARIRFRVLSVLGIASMITYNYFSPILMARSIAIDPTQEPARRELWLILSLTMLIGAGFVLLEAIKGTPRRQTKQSDRAPFLQTPVMVYVFALILIMTSGTHLYAMAFTFVLERMLGDYVPVTLMATLLLLEILRHSGKRFGFSEFVISCIPLVITMIAIHQKSVIASGQFGVGLICYPPIILALSGLAIAGLAVYHRWYPLIIVAFFYGLGVILTTGFSPEYPHDLNIHACIGTLTVALLVYGTFKRNQYICLVGIIILCFELYLLDNFSKFVLSCNLTEIGAIAGVCGLGFVFLYLVFGRQLDKIVRFAGALCLAGFIFDYLPEYIHWRYMVILLGTGLLTAGLWLGTRDILVISTLWMPICIRLYMVAKQIAHWRFVILGFLLLGAGTIASLLKRPIKDQTGEQNQKSRGDSSP